VVVTVAGQSSGGVAYTVTGGPSINTNGLTPSSGSAGTTVAIAVSNFGSTQGSSVVKFNGLAAKISSWGTGTTNAIAPTGVTTGPVTVTVSGQTSNGVTFTAITNGTLSGTVTNSSSVAISGATIQALQNGISKASATTASNGTYSIASLAAGTYDIQASASTFGTALQNAVSVTANHTTTQNFTLSAPGSVGGKVTQSDGVTAISGAAVQVFVGSAVASSTTTDSGGNYSVANLNAGSYRAQVSASGFIPKSETVPVTAGSNATANFTLSAPGTAAIQYEYDELGRLVGVVDAAGDSASYQYDPVGNVLSISRQASNQVSIINFTPRSGPTGTTVTINGEGFSATSSQDTVQFNGTTATVLTATTTQITANVPSGATTGPIKVIAPSGTVTSSTNFTVGTANGVPTITSFTPNMGTVGIAVSITGTNFDGSVANNRLTFNIASAVTSSVNTPPTQLGTSIPSTPPVTDLNTPPNIPPATSGRISLSTPAGKTTSSQDFYVPFNAHIVTDIGWTGRFSLGGSQPVSIPAGKIGLLLFDGAWGRGLTIQLSGSSITNCTLYVFAPDGTKLGINNSNTSSDCSSATTGPLAISTLPLNGTYTIGVENGSAIAGNLTIGTISDAQGSISIDGPQVAISTTVPNQDARLVFSAIAGQRIGTFVTNVSNPVASVSLLNTDGTVQPHGIGINGPPGQTFFMDTHTLAKTGNYQLWIAHSGNNFGSETLQVKTVQPDITGILTVPTPGTTGPTITPAPTTAGQNAFLTFSGTIGQQLGFNVANPQGYPSGGCTWFLNDPLGAQVTSGQCYSASFVDPQTVGSLKKTGTYTVFIDPQGAAIGSSTWSINNDADVTGSIAIDGPSIPTGSGIAGQDVRLSFPATGQRIVVFVTSVGNPSANVNLVTPGGSNQGFGLAINSTPAGQTFFMDTQSLGTGTYQLWVQHNSSNFGSETLQINSVPADVSGSITVNGSGLSFTTVAGQNATITFSNPQTQSVTLHWTAGTYPTTPGCTLTATKPGNSQSSTNCNVATGSLALGSLSGSYSVTVNPQAQSTGGLTLSVTSP